MCVPFRSGNVWWGFSDILSRKQLIEYNQCNPNSRSAVVIIMIRTDYYLCSGEYLWVSRDPGKNFTEHNAKGENIHLEQAWHDTIIHKHINCLITIVQKYTFKE